MKVLLLNPPGQQLYIRDYYCSKVAKAGYIVHPVDLLMLSGRLAERFEIQVIDALADGIRHSACLAMIDSFAPDVVISVSGAVSMEEDRAFLSRLCRPGRRIVVSGDVVLDRTRQWLEENPYADAALLDFMSDDIVAYIESRTENLRCVVTCGDSITTEPYIRPVNQEISVPIPRHDLFTSRHYRYPFSKRKKFATVLTDYGCPCRCSFCVMSTLGYQYRTVDNVMDELRFLKGMGLREIYFSDQTFGAIRSRVLDLCERMREEQLGFGWCCFSRADILTEEMLAAMQGAGCHTVMLGVESADEEILKKYRKGYTLTQVREAVQRCKARGIRTVATFLLGLPEETEASAAATIALARELDCDFASFNVAVPRMGTALRQQAIGEGLIDAGLATMDQTGLRIAMPSRHLTTAQLQEIRVRAVREFYLRPQYLWRRLAGISSCYELREHLREGWFLLRGGRRRFEH